MKKDLLSTKGAKSPMQKAQRLMELLSIQKEIKPEIDKLKGELLVVTQELGVLTLKTDKYTISRAKRITPDVTDFDALKKALKKAKVPFGTKEVFSEYMGPVFKTFIEEGRKFPGLDGKETEYISVRVKEEKHDK